MKRCVKWQFLLEPTFGRSDPWLANHVQICPECSRALRRWKELEPEIAKSVAEDVDILPVRDWVVLDRIHARLEARGHRKRLRLAWVIATAVSAATAAVVLAMLLGVGPKGNGQGAAAPDGLSAGAPIATIRVGGESRTQKLHEGEVMRLGADERATIALGGHRIDLEAGAAMKLALVSKAAVVVELVRGAAVFDVDFQTENGLFSVQVEDAVVSVKGTRFRVRTDDGIVSIAVSEGLVGIVRQGREVARLAAGEKIEFDIGNSMFVVPGSTESAPPSPSMIDSDPGDADSGSSYTVPPAIDRGEGAEAASAKSMGAGVRASREAEGARQADTVDRGAGTEATTLAALKNLAVDGRLQEALEGLEEYVVLHPADAEAWFLVGECRRKLGDHTGAVDAYGRVVATGSDDKADIARLKAGIVLQDKLGRHGEAVGFFETMLNEKSDASPLRAEVLLRCARSLLALGRDAEARLRLQEIVSEYGANPAAVEAREILRGLE